MSDFKKNLRQKAYMSVPFSIPQTTIDEAVKAFMKYLNEPDEVKRHISFSVNPVSRRGDVGYTFRDPKDSIYNDSKEYFHHHDAIFHRYPDFLDANPVVKNFVKKASPIWKAAREKGKEIIAEFETESPGITRRFFGKFEGEVLLRFLKYDWQTCNKHLAKPHFDAGSFTLAIAESDPGLRIGTNNDDLQEVKHYKNEAIFMPSKNFPRHFENCSYPSAWHDVIQTNETQIGKSYSRWAVVCFFEAEGMKAVPRSETHEAA